MKNLLLTTLIIVAIGIMSSCNKKDSIATTTNSNGTTGPYTSLSTVMKSLEVTPITVNFDVATGGSFYGPNGTRFIFYPNTFQTLTGVSVTGTIQVQIADYNNKSDILFSGILPYSNGDPIISGGEVYVNAKQGTTPLMLKPGTIYQTNIPGATASGTGMQLFYGTKISDTGSNKVNWRKSQDSLGMIIYNGDTISVFPDSLGYCNADKFLASPSYQSFTINVTGVTINTAGELKAFAVYDNYKGVWSMFGASGSNSFTEGHVPNIPVHFVVLCIVNGNFYGGILGVTPTTGSTYTVNVSQTDPISFKTQVSALK